MQCLFNKCKSYACYARGRYIAILAIFAICAWLAMKVSHLFWYYKTMESVNEVDNIDLTFSSYEWFNSIFSIARFRTVEGKRIGILIFFVSGTIFMKKVGLLRTITISYWSRRIEIFRFSELNQISEMIKEVYRSCLRRVSRRVSSTYSIIPPVTYKILFVKRVICT